MIAPNRPVDIAMHANHLDKQTVRNLWIQEVSEIANRYPNSPEPWYLTLSGAEGLDIQLLIDRGLISLTEVNSIVEKDQRKIVAIERSNNAVLELQKKFIGLQIKQMDFKNLIRGDGLISFPNGDDREVCRARVVNLDLNSPFNGLNQNRNIVFPVVEWIKKLCRIHSIEPRMDWTLCLTLQGEIRWPLEVSGWIKKFLNENIQHEQVFSESCKEFLGEDLFNIVNQREHLDFNILNPENQQNILMIIVPKIIASFAYGEGWMVQTEKSLRYGGGDRAPMVSWIVKFTWDDSAGAAPHALYSLALSQIFSGLGVITTDGIINPL